MKKCHICQNDVKTGVVVHQKCIQALVEISNGFAYERDVAQRVIKLKNQQLESLIGKTPNVLTPGDQKRRDEGIPPYERYRLLKHERGGDTVLAVCDDLDGLVHAAYHFGVLHPRTPAEISAEVVTDG
ncbi:MAG: hypothetical protein IJV64_03335 [Oscillospiraceae bacterium]|nr:hypothetical protein [Oscillospiraceae bacterium]